MTTAIETEATSITINDELIDMVVGTENSAPLNRGLSLVTRNRILIALAQPQGLEYLSYGDGDTVDNVREAIRTTGEWLVKVANEAQ